MAGSLALIAGQPYQGQPVASPLYLKRPHPAGSQPTRVSFNIDWSIYGASPTNQQVGVLVNLVAGNNAAQKIDSIRSIYIDNSFSDVPVYVYFPDSGFVAVAAPNVVTIQPVMTSSVQALIYAEGFTEVIPSTTVIFTNAEIEPYFIDTRFVLPPVLTYIASTQAASAANNVSKVFNNIALGALALKRDNIFVMQWVEGTSPAALQSVTIGASVFTIVEQVPSQVSGFQIGGGAAIVYNKNAALSGNRAVTATFDQVVANAVLHNYSLINHQDDDPVDGAAASSNGTGNVALSVTPGLPKTSVSVYGAATVTGPGGVPCTMTNSVIDNSGSWVVGGLSIFYAASHYQAAIDISTRSINNTGAALVGAVWQ